MRFFVSVVALAAALLAMPAPAQLAVRDAGGNIVTTATKTLPDGTKAPEHIRVDSGGVEKGTTTNPDTVTDPGIGSASAPAPGTVNAQLGSAIAQLTSAVAGLNAILAKLPATPLLAGGNVAVTNLPGTQPVSASALPLPGGASTEATLAAVKALLGAAPAQDATLQTIKTLLGASPAQDSSLQAIKVLLGAAPAQDASIVALTGRINALITAMGNPAQVGGAIANTGFAINGSLPSFATTQTFNLGTLGGAATAARQDSFLAALGSPFQAGGNIGNTAFGISGTLPSFATTQTFNLGSLNGAAVASNQAPLTAPGVAGATGTTATMVLPQLAATDRGALIGTTSATLMPANTSRHFIVVQVQPGAGSCYINGTATATADYHSLLIAAGATFESSSHVGTGAISIICTSSNTSVYAREG